MKKLLYLFLVLPLIFSSCKKDDDDNTPTAVPGCMDQAACNYNPNATTNNNSCDYSCYGCMDDEATNYDSEATVDDGSCNYSLEGIWEYNYWTFDGNNVFDVFPWADLYLWEMGDPSTPWMEGEFGVAIYDVYGYLSDASSIGVFTMTENQESAVFTILAYYDPVYDDFYTVTPESINATIDKLDGDELDFTVNYPSGETEIIHSDWYSAHSPMNPDGNSSHSKQLPEMLNALKRIRK